MGKRYDEFSGKKINSNKRCPKCGHDKLDIYKADGGQTHAECENCSYQGPLKKFK